MSDDDTYHELLEDEIYEEHRSKYVQWVIQNLDDPDYKGVPVVIDPVIGVMTPADMPKKGVLRVIKWAKQFIKEAMPDDTIH